LSLLVPFIVLVLVAVLAGWVIGLYNGLVRLRNQAKNAWAQIDVQLKRRYDLIPNLVETAKGYLKHERETLEAVIKARQMAIDASSIQDKIAAENVLTSSLRSLMMVSEAYPDLKANQTMLSLQEELTSTENKIGFARQFYNDSATEFRNRCQMFPSNIVAGIFGFDPGSLPLYEVDSPAERVAPKVQF
jgi:LemA protein